MMNSTRQKVIKRIRANHRGWVFTPASFFDLAAHSVIYRTLHSLTQNGFIRRISRGLYDFPQTHPKLGQLSPAKDKVAQAIAMRSGDTIQPSGAQAANWLGLSTQVPAKVVYLTTGRPKQVKVGNLTVHLQHTPIVPLLKKPDMASLTVQALLHLGKDHITPITIKKCADQLSPGQKKRLLRMTQQTPRWLHPIIHQIAIH